MTEILTLINAVEKLRKNLSHQLPSQHISILLLTAAQPGITQAALCDRLGMPQGTVSRNIKLLSRYYDSSNGVRSSRGYGLLVTRPLSEGAYPLGVFLTAKGEDLIFDVVEGMRTGSGSRALAS